MKLSVNAAKDLTRIRKSPVVRKTLRRAILHGEKVAHELVQRHPRQVREILCTADEVSRWKSIFREQYGANHRTWPKLRFGTPNQIGDIAGTHWSAEPIAVMRLPKVEEGKLLLPPSLFQNESSEESLSEASIDPETDATDTETSAADDTGDLSSSPSSSSSDSSSSSQKKTTKKKRKGRRGKPWIRRVAVLDCISDPGNLGNLIRSAEAFGWDSVFLIKEPEFATCDPWNDRALRAGRGAHFGIKHFGIGSTEDLLKFLEHRTLVRKLYIGSPHGEAELFPPEHGRTEPVAVALGNEHTGGALRQLLEALEDRPHPIQFGQTQICGLRIPIRSESINVAAAGAIIMSHFTDPLESQS